MKISKVIFHIKPIPSHPWWECKKYSPKQNFINVYHEWNDPFAIPFQLSKIYENLIAFHLNYHC